MRGDRRVRGVLSGQTGQAGQTGQPAVLVLDDDEDVREIIGEAVEELLGWPAVTEGDNAAAVELLLSAPRPLVVLLDRYMRPLPFDVLLAILASPAAWVAARLRRHRYVVLTASPKSIGARERELLAQELDHAPIVAKPFDLDELERVLRAEAEVLARRERERERESEMVREGELVLAAR